MSVWFLIVMAVRILTKISQNKNVTVSNVRINTTNTRKDQSVL